MRRIETASTKLDEPKGTKGKEGRGEGRTSKGPEAETLKRRKLAKSVQNDW